MSDRASSDRASRQYELDWLRLLAVVSVVALHLAQTYSQTAGDSIPWLVARSETLSRVLELTMYVRMPVLFCLAGMVAVHSRGRRPLDAYLRTRAERLLLPLLLGLAVLAPAQHALELQLTGRAEGLFAWGNFWFLGTLATITVATVPIGLWLARPGVQARLASAAPSGITLVLMGGLPLLGTLLPYRWLPTAELFGHTDAKGVLTYAGYFVTGMVLASTPAFRPTVMHGRRVSLLVWAAAAAIQALASRFGLDGHVAVLAGGVAGWAWVLTCYGFAARYLSGPSPVLERWAPRALALYVFHGVALAAAKSIVLPIALPLATQVAALVTLTGLGTLTLVRLSESGRESAKLLGLRYAPANEEHQAYAWLAGAYRAGMASLGGIRAPQWTRTAVTMFRMTRRAGELGAAGPRSVGPA